MGPSGMARPFTLCISCVLLDTICQAGSHQVAGTWMVLMPHAAAHTSMQTSYCGTDYGLACLLSFHQVIEATTEH